MKIKWLLSRIKWVARKEGSPLPNKSSTKSASFHSHSFDIYLHLFFLHILVHLPKHNVGYTELNVNLKFKYTLWLWNHRKQSLLMTFFFMLLLMSPILPPFLASINSLKSEQDTPLYALVFCLSCLSSISCLKLMIGKAFFFTISPKKQIWVRWSFTLLVVCTIQIA